MKQIVPPLSDEWRIFFVTLVVVSVVVVSSVVALRYVLGIV